MLLERSRERLPLGPAAVKQTKQIESHVFANPVLQQSLIAVDLVVAGSVLACPRGKGVLLHDADRTFVVVVLQVELVKQLVSLRLNVNFGLAHSFKFAATSH